MTKFKHEEIYRGKGFDRLGKLALTVCGAGALGSNLVDSLARQGFSNIKVVDFDRVEEHNVNTQVYGDFDVGALKVDALRTRIFRHIGCEVTAVSKRLTAENARQILKGSGLVVDVFDNSESRRLVQDTCRNLKLPCLHAGLFEGYGEVRWDEKYKVPQAVEGDVCDYPLARNLAILVTCIAAEEIVDFAISKKPRHRDWSVTLKDLAVRPMVI